jgi:hypothetical protein
MVIKVWREPGDGGPLRARITDSTDAREGHWSVSTCGSDEEILQTIDRWLHRIP